MLGCGARTALRVFGRQNVSPAAGGRQLGPSGAGLAGLSGRRQGVWRRGRPGMAIRPECRDLLSAAPRPMLDAGAREPGTGRRNVSAITRDRREGS